MSNTDHSFSALKKLIKKTAMAGLIAFCSVDVCAQTGTPGVIPSATPAVAPAAQTSTVGPGQQPAPASSPVVTDAGTATTPDAPGGGARAGSPALPSEKTRPVSIPLFEKPPVVDGLLDDEAWKSAAVLKDFYQVQPGDNITPSKQTQVLLGYDAKFLYIAFRAQDDAGKVRATVAKRDQITDDDNVSILLDTFDDQRKAYVFAFNPLGIQADAILTEGRGEDYSVDVVMDSKGVITESGYIVEVAFLSSLCATRSGRESVGEFMPCGASSDSTTSRILDAHRA